MAKNNVLITGISGLLGEAITERLQGDYNIIGLDLNPPEADIKFYQTDLTNRNSVKESLQRIKQDGIENFASIIHLAAYYDFTGEPSPLYEKLTVNGTETLLEELKDNKIKYEQFLFSSTHLVAESVDRGELITEDSPLKAEWDYPQSKIDAEKIIEEKCEDGKSVLLRISGAYDEQGHSPPITQQMRRIFEKQLESYLYPGDPEKGQPFVHIKDITSAVQLCVEKREELKSKEIFYVAETELLSYRDLQTRIGQLMYGKKWGPFPIPKFVAKLGAWFKNVWDKEKNFIKPWMIDLTEAHYPVSNKRLREKLGWEPKYRLYEVLPKMVSFLKQNPAQWYKINDLGEPPAVEKKQLHFTSNKKETNQEVSEVPPWDYNPSSWSQRIPICIIALIGFAISTYLAYFQWGFIDEVWDPIFGIESQRVIDSNVSHTMYKYIGIPDAALGAFAYLGDAVFGIAGSTKRWRDRPWLVIVFGIDVIPLGIVSVILVLIQGFYLNAWCFLCLVTAVISIILIILAYDEVWSSIRYLYYVRKKYPKYFWNIFWGIKPPEEIEKKYLIQKVAVA